MEVSKDHMNMLKDLKKMVEDSQQYFKKNAERYREFMAFVFHTSLTPAQRAALDYVNKPPLEFNIIESIINKLCGEFAKQEPSITVSASEGIRPEMLTEDFIALTDFLGNLLRYMTSSSTSDGFQSKLYKDLLGGGYSVAEVYVDYLNPISFDKKIMLKRVFDPTMTGFDPLARESHKGDGQYCFQLIPYTKEQFMEEFPNADLSEVTFTRGGGFNWTYNSQGVDVVLICDFYMKKQKKTRIVKLSSGHTVTKKHYEELLVEWNERQGFIEQAPIIIEERMTQLESIVRYRFCETKVLAFDQTDYDKLPLVFFDGNSVEIADDNSNNTRQMTKPYAYAAKGIQQLKNVAGQSIAYEIENTVQHKFIVSVESIPSDYTDAYKNVQKASVLVYNSFFKGDVNVPLAPPREVQRTPTPPLIENTFLGSDQVTQAILGSYNDVLNGTNDNVSGVAITQGALQSSAAATPYTLGYVRGINRVYEIILDLVPKFYKTPRTLPVMTADGKRGYQLVNFTDENDEQVQGSLELQYQPQDLHVKVEAGVNTAIAKQVALDQIIRMSQASPLFAEFINLYGLEPILDNMDIRGIDALKASAVQFMQQKQQQAEQAAGEENPEAQMVQVQQQMVEVEGMKAEAEMASVEQKAQATQNEFQIKVAGLALEKEKIDIMRMKAEVDAGISIGKLELDHEKVDSENARTAIETAMSISKAQSERAQTEVEVKLD